MERDINNLIVSIAEEQSKNVLLQQNQTMKKGIIVARIQTNKVEHEINRVILQIKVKKRYIKPRH